MQDDVVNAGGRSPHVGSRMPANRTAVPRNHDFYTQLTAVPQMATTLACRDYGFECAFRLDGDPSISLIGQLRDHFEDEHGIDYPQDAVVQMVVNKGHSLESIRRA